MTIFQSFVLGIIQGLTEFLPVSSSGHLIFIPKFLGWADQGILFDIFINIGTLIAVVIFFRKKLWDIAKSCLHYKSKLKDDLYNRKLFWLMVLSTLPAAVFGLLLGDFMETYSRSALLVGADMIVWGIVLGYAEYVSQKHEEKNIKNLAEVNVKHSVFMGFAQVLAALFPGTSRSGITMTAGMFGGLSKSIAAEFSFLMSIPIISLALANDVLKIIQHGTGGLGFMPLFVGSLSAMIAGFFALSLLRKIIQKWSFKPFVVYRILVGILILWVLA